MDPILSVVDHVKLTSSIDIRPWLLLGKGPTAARFGREHAERYHVLALNHACGLLTPYPDETVNSVAHFTDLEALIGSRDALASQRQRPVCLPWYPHRDHAPGRYTLGQHLADTLDPALILRGHPVLSYNSTLAHRRAPHPDLPTIRVRFFSAVAGFNILAAAGQRAIATLGIDGGTTYAPGFAAADCLANGRPSFDVQFTEIARTCQRDQVRLCRL